MRVCPSVLVFACLLTSGVSFGREAVCLRTGYCLEADSHELLNDSVVLRLGSGTMAVPADQIDHIEMLANQEQRDPKKQARAAAHPKPEELVSAAADAEGLDQAFVRSVAKVESDFRQDAVSSKGAVGIMQLMPGTAAVLGVNGKDAAENAAGGAKYLRQLLLQYHGDAALALAAYNAGPQAVAKYGGVPPYLETREYVIRVIREYERQTKRKRESEEGEKPSATP